MKPHIRDKVDALFKAWDRDDSPGCVLGLIHGDEMVYTRGYGMANLEYGIPITPETIFYIASTSKQFTAACILLLAQKGHLSLQDDIRTYLSEMNVYTQPIRVEHLILHTSGLREHGVLSELAGLCPLDYRTADAVALVCRQKGVNYPAGESFLYNNAGYVLLAEIVERVSGQPFAHFVQEQIFDPLGMRSTHFGDDCTRIVPNRAASYEAAAGGGYRQLLMSNNVLGSAGVMTSVHDLQRWESNFHHPLVGGEGFVRQMERRGQLNNGESLNYGMGLMHGELLGMKTIFHTGTEFGYRSIMLRFPEQRFTILCLANLASFSPDTMAEKVARVWLAEQTQAGSTSAVVKIETQPEIDLEEITGLYTDPQSGAFTVLTLQEGKLFAEVLGSALPLLISEHTASAAEESISLAYAERYLSMPLDIRLERKDRSSDWVMQAALGSCEYPALRRLPQAGLEEGRLAEYCGVYYSPELQTAYELCVKNGKLATTHPRGLRGALTPGQKDFFVLPGVSLRFYRNKNMQIEGFHLWELRARNIEFTRSTP